MPFSHSHFSDHNHTLFSRHGSVFLCCGTADVKHLKPFNRTQPKAKWQNSDNIILKFTSLAFQILCHRVKTLDKSKFSHWKKPPTQSHDSSNGKRGRCLHEVLFWTIKVLKIQFKKYLSFLAVFAHYNIPEEETIYRVWFLGNLSCLPADNACFFQSLIQGWDYLPLKVSRIIFYL